MFQFRLSSTLEVLDASISGKSCPKIRRGLARQVRSRTRAKVKRCSWPNRPTWKNIPMIAIIASLPLASSAESFLVFSAGSDAVNTLNPKSPAAAGVPGD
eukprot:Skav207328  [mRNA]  locus=scaffold3027:204226:210297:+ [translate_table: standard]